MPASRAKPRYGLRLAIAAAALLAAVLAVLFFLRPTAYVVAVRRGHAVDARPGSITVAPGYSEDIKGEVGGRIVRSDLDEGTRFKTGQFMAQLDTGDLELELQHAKNDVAALERIHAVGSQSQIDWETAKANLARDERLYQLGEMARLNIDNEKRAVEEAEQKYKLDEVTYLNTLEADELVVKEKQREIDKMTITAPFDGVVSVVYARPGQVVASETPIATLISASRTVEARISEEKFAGIEIGQRASVIFLGSSRIYEAKVSKILPTAEAATQRYVAYLDVDIPQDELMPGQTGEVSIEVATHPSALLAPRRAIVGNNALVVEDGRVELRKVKVGYTSETDVEILDGLKEGDLVITDDLDRFSPGDRVSTQLLAD